MNKLIVETLNRYVNNHIETGGFLRAVLENDLREAFGRADHINQGRMFEIVEYCYKNIPGSCWGSKEAVKNWLGE